MTTWNLSWPEGKYRLENQSTEQLIQIRRREAEQKQCLIAELDCQWCEVHGEPVVNSRGMCAYCEDQLFG